MFKKLAIAAVVALSSFGAVPDAMAQPYCSAVEDGVICVNELYRRGYDFHGYFTFNTTDMDWQGTISCRDNPTTFSWEYNTTGGYAPKEYMDEFAPSFCETILYS